MDGRHRRRRAVSARAAGITVAPTLAAWLEAHSPVPLDDGRRRVLHGDPYGRHVLVDAEARPARYRAIYHAVLQLDYGLQNPDAGMQRLGNECAASHRRRGAADFTKIVAAPNRSNNAPAWPLRHHAGNETGVHSLRHAQDGNALDPGAARPRRRRIPRRRRLPAQSRPPEPGLCRAAQHRVGVDRRPRVRSGFEALYDELVAGGWSIRLDDF
jgi:hypothetical protein